MPLRPNPTPTLGLFRLPSPEAWLPSYGDRALYIAKARLWLPPTGRPDPMTLRKTLLPGEIPMPRKVTQTFRGHPHHNLRR